MEQNICHFIPYRNDNHSLHTINFVLETKSRPYTRLKSESVYKVYYVCSGKGYLHTLGKISPLKAGDLFFTFPANAFAIESSGDLVYMYISFVGLRGNMILEKLGINANNCLFHQTEELREFWEKGISTTSKAIELISESILLYTFSFLTNRLLPDSDSRKQHHGMDLIKKYLDDHFTDHNFSLETMSDALSYNKKYLSHVFKKHFGIGIIDYINTVRIQNACTMMEQGFTSVNTIADQCGYSDAQYFSKIFKSKIGLSPTQYIHSLQADKE